MRTWNCIEIQGLYYTDTWESKCILKYNKTAPSIVAVLLYFCSSAVISTSSPCLLLHFLLAFANIYYYSHDTQPNTVLSGAEGHFWSDYYSTCDESGLCRHSLLSAMQNVAWWKWNPITPSVMLIICYVAVNNQLWPFMSPTGLSRSWHRKKKRSRWDLGLLSLNGFNNRRCIWFIVCCIWRNGTAIPLFFPLRRWINNKLSIF